MKKLISLFFPPYTKWVLIEIYKFDASYYSVHVRQNLRTGYKQFRVRKIVRYHYGSAALTAQHVNGLFPETNSQ